MTLLSRKSSNEAIVKDGGGKSRGRAASSERDQNASKPSLLRRLSKTISRSEDAPKKKDASHPILDQSEIKTSQKQLTTELADKAPEPKVDELPPTATIQSVHKEPVKAKHHPPAHQPTNGHTLMTTRGATDPQRHTAHGSTTDFRTEARDEQSNKKNGLTKNDVEHLFNGAPQFILEKGRRGRYFPQAFFPWNNDLEVGDLQDRRFLKHESFAFCTLHAHLPIPDEVGWAPGMPFPIKKAGLETGKRPLFELGIYERPNMLAQEGREPGTVGLRYFLERPVADGVQDSKTREHGKDVEIDLALGDAPAREAFKMLALSRDNDQLNAKVGKHAPEQDRLKLIHEGPQAWKSVGVRPITMQSLVDRLKVIDDWRDRVVTAGWRATVLDQMKSPELHDHLFGELLYPPRRLQDDSKYDNKEAMKVQIEALVKVLATPGAWLDLSVPEARLRFGKILHSRTTQYDHATCTMTINPERKWLLVQVLLAIELVVRLDAALRLGIAMHAENFEISGEEIHHFNKLRTLKVDWDLVIARRFLDLCYAKRNEHIDTRPESDTASHKLETTRSHLSRKTTDHHGGFLGGLRHTFGLDAAEAEPDVCDVAILPRDLPALIDGVFRFATNIGWPRAPEIQESLSRKLCHGTPEERERFLMDAFFCTDEAHHAPHEAQQSTVPPLDNFGLNVHAATPNTIGGWLSHSWFSGLILPGNSTCDMLMATLLENDTDPATLASLGTVSLPFRSSGFVLGNSSWWSKSSIIGRVMAPLYGSKESMGWIYLPQFVPLIESTSKPVSSRWLKIKTFPVPSTREQPRILDGDKLAMESSPLGRGKGGIMGAEFSMVTDHILDHDHDSHARVSVNTVQLHLSHTNATAASPDHVVSAWAQFDLSIASTDPARPSAGPVTVSEQVRYGLDRAVYFVTAFPCRLPHGHATFKDGDGSGQHPQHKTAEHLPAHPLHKTYKFVTKTLDEIIRNNPRLEPPGSGMASTAEVWIVDARHALTPAEIAKYHGGGAGRHSESSSMASASASAGTGECGPGAEQIRNKDILVRAWCAEKGRNALIARVGRTCLSCAIREAKALEVGVIVRVGVKE
ncbi:hypothetical protein LTR47_006822 [Exophiala xenobiotica]|nr:hypothetical protein LTR47_006822 [Exophiala xenobiotica]KAK5250690.1 hypothetical protein LTS06_004574 [Exophiala xenobiotica]KAK5353258.1 hypothetical protein LTR61_003216 [Exophiala xenobiotica]KAK5380039.1 hypothetical protein LTR11_003668 [Exophiala xenobiotica]KAK5390901.1 hypothetical protein LTS03_000271 [Exophiala xenobiotica]